MHWSTPPTPGSSLDLGGGVPVHSVSRSHPPRPMGRQSGRDRRILTVACHRSQAHRDFTARASHYENCPRHFDPVMAASWSRPWTRNSSSAPRQQSTCHPRKNAPQTAMLTLTLLVGGTGFGFPRRLGSWVFAVLRREGRRPCGLAEELMQALSKAFWQRCRAFNFLANINLCVRLTRR
jgi:hypothetical protein